MTMTPAELKEIRDELGLSEPEFATALDLPSDELFKEFRSGSRRISAAMADRAERLLDDWRYAGLILERKVRPQYEEILASGEKPQKIALTSQLDLDNPDHAETTRAESRLSLFKHLDKRARTFFEAEGVEVISKVEFIKAPEPISDEEPLRELSILGIKVEAL